MMISNGLIKARHLNQSKTSLQASKIQLTFKDVSVSKRYNNKKIRNGQMKMSVPKSGSSKEVVLQCGETPSIFEVTKAVLKTTQSFQRGHHLHHFQLSYL